jgi:polyisoprenoid-binding protein YceI
MDVMKRTLFAAIVLTIVFTACKKDKDDETAYQVNGNTSVALWKGSTSATANTGSLDITSTSLLVKDNKVTRGSFVIPIASIKNFNLPDELKNVLLDHLKTIDFFNIAVHPDARFELKHVRPYIGDGVAAIPGANQFVTGDFTMIGKTLPLSFPARIEFVNDSLHLEAKFNLDRTKWGMNYSSDPELGEHYINKDVEIHLQVHAGRK